MTHPLSATPHGRYESRLDANGFHVHHASRAHLCTLDGSGRPIWVIGSGDPKRKQPFTTVIEAGEWAESKIRKGRS
jgi:hypothetical protein